MKRFALGILLALSVLAAPAAATPVCTDGFMGGPPASLCGGRIFPEAERAVGYVQYSPDPLGFIEYQHGIQYLAQKYPRWVSVTTTKEMFGDAAISAGGRDIQVIKITDHQVADKGKETLFYSLSVHGNERGGLEGGLRTAEDLAIAAEGGGKLVDGIDNYESSTGRKATFHEPEVADVLAKEAVYLVDFNPDGWAVGDFWNPPAPALYSRGNGNGTDLNRQMPTIGRINPGRNPLEEPEADAGVRLMREVAAAGKGGLMAYGADIHGEINSQAYMDVMYPAGEFDSVDHRRLMSIAERTKSVIDATLFEGIVEEIENATGGNDAEYARAIPVKPAHWATVWDTLGYTDTGFIGDYMATDLGVTGMDYEIFFNHTIPEKVWNDLPAGEPHQRLPRDHQDGDGVRAVPAQGVQRAEREGAAQGPRRLRGQRRHGVEHGRQRPGQAARPGGRRHRGERQAGRAGALRGIEHEVVRRHEPLHAAPVLRPDCQGDRRRSGRAGPGRLAGRRRHVAFRHCAGEPQGVGAARRQPGAHRPCTQRTGRPRHRARATRCPCSRSTSRSPTSRPSSTRSPPTCARTLASSSSPACSATASRASTSPPIRRR